MNIDLKPCPFCGGKVEIQPWKYNRHLPGFIYDFVCLHCGCSFHAGYCETEDEAIAKWNTRLACYDCQMGGVPATEENMAKYGWVKERTCHATKVDSFTWGCSECGGHWHDAVNYCPNCGAKVVE